MGTFRNNFASRAALIARVRSMRAAGTSVSGIQDSIEHVRTRPPHCYPDLNHDPPTSDLTSGRRAASPASRRANSSSAAENRAFLPTIASSTNGWSFSSGCGPHPKVFVPDQPTLSITEADPGATVMEGMPATFNVSLSGSLPQNGVVSVFYSTMDGTGKAVADYTPTDGPALLQFVFYAGSGYWFYQYNSVGVAISSGQCTQNNGASVAEIIIPTTARAVDASGETFSVVLSDPYDHYSQNGGATLAANQAAATATIMHPVATDADNDSVSGQPDGDSTEALFKDISPGKIVAVQKFETNGDGTLVLDGQGHAIPDPNTRFVPLVVTLPTLPSGDSAYLFFPSGLNVWTGSTTSNDAPVSSGSQVTASTTFYVEAVQRGQFHVDLAWSSNGTTFYLSDEALFTAVGKQPGTCDCCSSGTAVGSDSNLVMDQTFLGGAASVISTVLSQNSAGGSSINVSYSATAPTGFQLYSNGGFSAVAASGALRQSMSVGSKPYLVLAGNAILVVNDASIQIWDLWWCRNSQLGNEIKKWSNCLSNSG